MKGERWYALAASSHLVSMKMIVMGKYVLVEGKDREAFIVIWGLFLRVPIYVFCMDK
jgi:hypothetical protein